MRPPALLLLLALGVLACRSAGEPRPRSGIPMLEDAIRVAAVPEIGKPLPFQVLPERGLRIPAGNRNS